MFRISICIKKKIWNVFGRLTKIINNAIIYYYTQQGPYFSNSPCKLHENVALNQTNIQEGEYKQDLKDDESTAFPVSVFDDGSINKSVLNDRVVRKLSFEDIKKPELLQNEAEGLSLGLEDLLKVKKILKYNVMYC